MGCLKLTYYQGEGLEKSEMLFFGVLDKNLESEKRGINYCTFGKPLPQRSYTSSTLTNRRGYQGEWAEKDEETGWNNFYFRDFDPEIGRFLTFDPYNQYDSPYTGMGNDPINLNDPNGGFACGCWVGPLLNSIGSGTGGAIAGFSTGALNGGSQTVQTTQEEPNLEFSNENLRRYVSENWNNDDFTKRHDVIWQIDEDGTETTERQPGRTRLRNGVVTVYIHRSAFNSLNRLRIVTGHENQHVRHFSSGMATIWAKRYNSVDVAQAISEFESYTWQFGEVQRLGDDGGLGNPAINADKNLKIIQEAGAENYVWPY